MSEKKTAGGLHRLNSTIFIMKVVALKINVKQTPLGLLGYIELKND